MNENFIEKPEGKPVKAFRARVSRSGEPRELQRE